MIASLNADVSYVECEEPCNDSGTNESEPINMIDAVTKADHIRTERQRLRDSKACSSRDGSHSFDGNGDDAWAGWLPSGILPVIIDGQAKSLYPMRSCGETSC
jgi:hypothetical protein